MKQNYRSPEKDYNDPYRSEPLPVDRPAAIYYRQSTDAQIGNINTSIQTVDMFEHLVAQGWSRDSIIMIDMDAGVSGSTKLKDRPGMSRLIELIESNTISLVASQDVDRFFRDVTQIQTNIFIDICKRHHVRILTPRIIYDFNHPTMGAYHMKMFRDEAQHAADFLEYHIKGRLHRAKARLAAQGLWAGRQVKVGFMCDMRETLSDGSRNPNHRKYVEFTPCAEVIREYFKLFKRFNRNLSRTFEHIERHGPFYPEPETVKQLTPDGFKTNMNVRYRSEITGRLMGSEGQLDNIFTNVVYIGHWIHQGAIAQFYNHEAIVDEDLFMYAFNALSSIDFYGNPNPNYNPYRPFVRHPKESRTEPPPIYAGVIFTDESPHKTHTRMSTYWNSYHHRYHYTCYNKRRRLVFTVKATRMDKTINELLLTRLQATTIDENAWQRAVADTEKGGHGEIQRLRNDIRQAQRAKASIMENLKTLQHPDMVRNLEASYAAQEREIDHLHAELDELEAGRRSSTHLIEARPILELVIQRWDDVPRAKKRELFEAFAEHATCNRLDEVRRQVMVYWRDGSTSSHIFRYGDGARQHWSKAELEKLRDMVDTDRSQVDIMREFPHWSWHAITCRYLNNFTEDRRFVPYWNGEKKYPYRKKWCDTEEYKQEQASFNLATSNTSSRLNAFCTHTIKQDHHLESTSKHDADSGTRRACCLTRVYRGHTGD